MSFTGDVNSFGIFSGYRLFEGVYSGKKVMITGHTGFKGAWLALWLHALGAKVIGYALDPPAEPNLFTELKLHEKIIHVSGDVRDFEHLKSTIEQYQPQIVFHLAAQALVRRSYHEPHLTFETNIMGTVNILEAIRQNNCVEILINVTSDKCYDNKEWDYAYRENDPVGGFDPYSSSKGCAELVTSAYRNSFFEKGNINIATARAGNVIGGGDWAQDRVVPDCIRALTHGSPIKIRSPKAVRPWQHVLEPLSGYLWLAARISQNRPDFSEAWNFGPGPQSHVTVQEVVEGMIMEWGDGEWQSQEHEEQPHEAKLLTLDCSKANHLLDWQPVYDFETTIRVTTSWYKSYVNKENMFHKTLFDIQDYINEALTMKISWTMNGELEEYKYGAK